MVGLQVIPVPVVPSTERVQSANPEEEAELTVPYVCGDAIVSKKDTRSGGYKHKTGYSNVRR